MSNVLMLAAQALLMLYNWLSLLLRYMLESTIFKENPSVAREFSEAISILINITAIYIIMTLFEGLKKFLKVLLIIGWGLLTLAIILAAIS